MNSVRSIARTAVIGLALAVVVGVVTQGCGAQQGGAGGGVNLTKLCQVSQAIFDGFRPILDAKCTANVALGKDPLSDPYCLGIVGGSTGVQACFIGADNGDAEAVAKARAEISGAVAPAKPAAAAGG